MEEDYFSADVRSVFQEILMKFKNRNFADIKDDEYQMLFIFIHAIETTTETHGFPQDYLELRDWVYERVAKDIKYQDTSYLNDHWCIGAVWGALQMCDIYRGDHYWEEVKKSV